MVLVPDAYAVPADVVQYVDQTGCTVVAQVAVGYTVGRVVVVVNRGSRCSSSIMLAAFATERALC